MNTSVGDVENYSLDNFILLTCHHLQIFSFKSVLFFPTLRLGSRCATGTDPLCLHTCCQAGHPLSGLCVPSRQDYHLSCGPRGQQRIPHPPWCRKLWRSLLWYWIRLMATLTHYRTSTTYISLRKEIISSLLTECVRRWSNVDEINVRKEWQCS